MYVCMYERTYACMYLRMQECVNVVRAYVCVCVCVCVCAYLHGGLCLPFAKFVNLMLEDAFNFEIVEYSSKTLNLN